MSVPTVEPAARAAATPFLKTPPGRALQAIASLKLTVTLFALSMVLVFVGTLAQMDSGIHTVVAKYFRSWVVLVPIQLFVRLGQVFFGVPPTASVSGAFPFPGGWTIGGLLLVNLLAAHAVRFRFSLKRSGIIVLHAGILVLLLSELVTGLSAVEARMSINEGESADYAFRLTDYELVLANRSEPKVDDVVAVPHRRLERGGAIADERLPVDIEVVRWSSNATITSRPPANTPNPATAGEGLGLVAVEQKENSGVSASAGVDLPAAYVTLNEKAGGKSLGTYLVSVVLDPQPIEIDGKPYELALRFRRDYKPFRMHLIEFRFDRYQGTEIAKNYSSRVRLTDPTEGVDREVLIRMNEPLRYAGESYFQADFDKDTEKGTVLQVVRNPARQWPYIACGLVSGGMALHFGIHLLGFLRRRVA
jgi:hypothetical protein